MKTTIIWQLPLKIANEANSSDHWSKKSRRHKIQRQRIKAAFIENKPAISLPCLVKLTRIAPKQLDAHDNLRISLKWVVDAIAAELTGNYIPGQADGNPNISWEYSQEKGKPGQYGLIVEIIEV